MKTRTVDVIIAGRKIPGYPQYSFNFSFTTIEDLMKKCDEKADQLEIGKMDLNIQEDTCSFTDEEHKFMENEYCIIN